MMDSVCYGAPYYAPTVPRNWLHHSACFAILINHDRTVGWNTCLIGQRGSQGRESDGGGGGFWLGIMHQ
jgi:hypothetical protein